jgi:PAS domain S-box-containing protein
MTHQSAFYLLAVFAGLVANGILIVSIATRKSMRVGRLFLAILVLMFILSFSYLMIRVGRDESLVYFWSSMRYLCSGLMPVLFLLFVLDLTGYLGRLRRWTVAALFVLPIFMQLALWTNNAHHLFLKSWRMEMIEGLTVIRAPLGDLGFLHTMYALILIAISLFFLVRGFVKARARARQQYGLLLVSATCVIIPYTLFVLLHLTPIDMTPIGVSASALFIWLALARHRLFHLLPMAHSYIFDSVADAVFVIDEYQHVIEINRAAIQLTQRSYNNAVGAPLATLIPAFTQEHTQPFPEQIHLEVDGSSHFYEVKRSAITTSTGYQMGDVITLREITERKNAETRALELALERERILLFSRFVRSISHDLRTPLSVMNTAIYIARKSSNAEQRSEKLLTIEEQIKRMTGMIEDMHLLAKLDSGIALDMTSVRLEDVIHNVPTHIRRLVEDKQLRFHLDGSLPLRVCAQPDLLVRAYHNLLHNAVLYTQPEGSVTVRTYANDEGCGVIAVEDTGPGIAPEQLATVFEQFQKTNEARTSDGSGFGIGLPIARKITLAHRGKLEVSSTPGAGSVFQMILPLTHSGAK